MRSDWGADARGFIADATKDLPETATLKERRKALRGVGPKFHMFTSWGKKVWSRECRKYLERHGLAPKHALGTTLSSQGSRLKARMDTGDITFPFRGE